MNNSIFTPATQNFINSLPTPAARIAVATAAARIASERGTSGTMKIARLAVTQVQKAQGRRLTARS